jgi:hypothetical protein
VGVLMVLGIVGGIFAIVGGYLVLIQAYLAPPIARLFDADIIPTTFVLSFVIVLTIIGFAVGINAFKPEENKPARPSPENYHPECWDEEELKRK